MQNLKIAQENMIAGQMLPNEVVDEALLRALSEVRREQFVPESLKAIAYADENLPLGHGRVLMKPMAFARLLQLAEIDPKDRVLHVGAGMGYGSAVLAQLADFVMAVESQHDLAEAARQNLRSAEVNVEIFVSALTLGYPMSAPYNVIVIEGAVQQIPASIIEQLAEGGRIVAVKNVACRLDAASGLGRALVAYKKEGQLYQKTSFDVSVPLLASFEQKEEFVF